MFGCLRQFRSAICYWGKILEHNWNVSVMHNPSGCFVLAAKVPYLGGFQNLSFATSPRPCYQYFKKWRVRDMEAFEDSMEHHFLPNAIVMRRTFCSVSTASKPHCWNCESAPGDTTVPFLVCQFCKSIQPVDHSIDYYQIFGLDRNYEIKEDNLECKYKDWQKKLHPDLVHSKSENERGYAAEQSARVIDAYQTLGDPLSRAIYILKLEGIEVDEEERISDPELLDEMLEIREAVEEATDSPALIQLQAQMREKLTCWSKTFANAFESKKYDEALVSIRRMTYYKRANEEIIKKL